MPTDHTQNIRGIFDTANLGELQINPNTSAFKVLENKQVKVFLHNGSCIIGKIIKQDLTFYYVLDSIKNLRFVSKSYITSILPLKENNYLKKKELVN